MAYQICSGPQKGLRESVQACFGFDRKPMDYLHSYPYAQALPEPLAEKGVSR